MLTDEALARVEISHLLATYSISGDRADWDRMATIWAEDAVVLPPGGERFEGRRAIMDRFRAGGLRKRILAAIDEDAITARRRGESNYAAIPFTFGRHHLTSSFLEIKSDIDAEGLSYFLVMTDSGVDHCGTYQDRFRKIDGSWQISERKTRLDFIASDAIFGRVLRDAMQSDKAEAREVGKTRGLEA